MKLFDAHLHIIEAGFPLVPNQGFVPEVFSCADYLARMKDVDLVGGAVVSGSFQAFDQQYLIHALKTLGPSFVGVTQLPQSVSDEELLMLASAGVRALRFNLKRGGSESIQHLDRLARRVHEVVGWHVELYIDASGLGAIYDELMALPALSIDHLGLSKSGFNMLLRLVENGIKVKASGFGRVDFAIKPALRDLASANPDALMFGSDLPSTRAPRPFQHDDILLIQESFDENMLAKIMYQNALEFYGLNKPAN